MVELISLRDINRWFDKAKAQLKEYWKFLDRIFQVKKELVEMQEEFPELIKFGTEIAEEQKFERITQIITLRDIERTCNKKSAFQGILAFAEQISSSKKRNGRKRARISRADPIFQ